MKNLILIFSFLVAPSSFATGLSYGELSELSSVVKLVIEADGGTGAGTGAVVGLNPVTVVTAAHMAAKSTGIDKITLDGVEPEKILLPKGHGKNMPPNINPMTHKDLAVLIFPKKVNRPFPQRPVDPREVFSLKKRTPVWGEKIELCGYGVHYTSSGGYQSDERLRCGQTMAAVRNPKFAFENDPDIERTYAEFRKEADPTAKSIDHFLQWLFDKNLLFTAAKLIHQQNQYLMDIHEKKSDPTMGFGVFTPAGLDDPSTWNPAQEPLWDTSGFASTGPGDSGGPIFVTEPDGQRVLVGIISSSSFDLPLPHVGNGWKLDSALARELLKRARAKGASFSDATP